MLAKQINAQKSASTIGKSLLVTGARSRAEASCNTAYFDSLCPVQGGKGIFFGKLFKKNSEYKTVLFVLFSIT